MIKETEHGFCIQAMIKLFQKQGLYAKMTVNGGNTMKIEYTDFVLLNAELKQKNTRYHLSYKDETTVCIEPPGACSLTEDRKANALRCIKEYY